MKRGRSRSFSAQVLVFILLTERYAGGGKGSQEVVKDSAYHPEPTASSRSKEDQQQIHDSIVQEMLQVSVSII